MPFAQWVTMIFRLLGPILTFLIFSLQLFGLQSIGEACNSALGLENGNIPDSHISASSFLPYFFIGRQHKDMKPKYARLRNLYAWCTNRRGKQWLSVDLGKVMYVNAISSQGFQGVGDYYVTTYELAYSIDGTNWKFVSENNATKVFSGNINGVDIKKNSFGQIQARYIKFVPLTYQIRICLRLELFGCFRGNQQSILSTPYSTTEDKEKTKNLIIGLIIFAALVFLVVSPLLVYLVISKRKRQANYLHKFQDLSWNSNQIGVMPLKNARSECENRSILVNLSCGKLQQSYC